MKSDKVKQDSQSTNNPTNSERKLHFDDADGTGFQRAEIVVELPPEDLSEAQKMELDQPDKQASEQKAEMQSTTTSSSIAQMPLDYFGAAEHIAIGNTAFVAFCEANPKMSKLLKILEKKELCVFIRGKKREEDKYKLTLSPNLALSTGEIVAMGDFFGIPKEPICFGDSDTERDRRFLNAYQSLIKENPEQVSDLLASIDIETRTIQKAFEDGKKPSIALESIGDKQNRRYGNLTKYTVFPGTFFYSRYVMLAKMNFDHFGQEAVMAYGVGHLRALETARKAFREEDKDKKLKGLVEAFAQELFACHFLTDLFASGHVRTPREGLRKYVQEKSHQFTGKTVIAGFLAQAMHDEDSRQGLIVQSRHNKDQKGEPWKALGDSCYYESDNDGNSEQVCEAVKAGLQDIYQAYSGLAVSEKAYLNYIPKVKKDPQNTFPLFKEENGTVKRRKDLDNPKCSDYIENWSPTKTLLTLKAKSIQENIQEKVKELEQEIDEIGQLTHGNIECNPM